MVVGVAAAVAWLSPVTTYDYPAYGGIWRHILDGGNPWHHAVGDSRHFNAYGPLNVVLAYPYDLSPHLPKLIFALASVSASLYLASRARGRPVVVAYLLLAPPLWILYVHAGFNDALLGALLLFGAVAYDRERFVTSAVLIALAILFKFTPIFVVPFLCLPRRRVQWTFGLTLGACLAVGFGVAYLLWGEAIADPIRFGMQRPSSSASIFNFLDEHGIANLDFLGVYLIVASLVVVFLLDLAPRHAVVLGLSFVLLWYKAAHLQFYFSLSLLLVYLAIVEPLPAALVRAIAGFLIWWCAVVVAWKLGDRAWKQHLHAWIGLPTFVVHAWLNVALTRHAVSRRGTPPSRRAP